MRVWKKSELEDQIQRSDEMVRRSLLKLYERQTPDEVSAKETHIVNHAGFNKFDAKFLTSLAEQLKAKNFLSPKQIAAARKKLMKYSLQLTFIANIAYYESLQKMKEQLAIK